METVKSGARQRPPGSGPFVFCLGTHLGCTTTSCKVVSVARAETLQLLAQILKLAPPSVLQVVSRNFVCFIVIVGVLLLGRRSLYVVGETGNVGGVVARLSLRQTLQHVL